MLKGGLAMLKYSNPKLEPKKALALTAKKRIIFKKNVDNGFT